MQNLRSYLSRAERSDCWRSKSKPTRHSERKKPDKRYQKNTNKDHMSCRRPRVDPPHWKGAVERPYTLPSGPITVLRRPTSQQISTQEQEVYAPISNTPSSGNMKRHGRFPSNDSKENLENTTTGSKARVVNTKFGEGFLVENPPTQKTETFDTFPSTGRQMKVVDHSKMTRPVPFV